MSEFVDNLLADVRRQKIELLEELIIKIYNNGCRECLNIINDKIKELKHDKES